MDIEEIEKETLRTKIEFITEKLKTRKQRTEAVQKTINDLYNTCIRELEANEERCLKLLKGRFKTLRKTVDGQKLEIDNDICHDLHSFHQYEEVIHNIQENTEDDDASREDIAGNMETVHLIEESFKCNPFGQKTYQFFEYHPRQDVLEHHVEILCDQLVKSERKFSEVTAAETTSDFVCTGDEFSVIIESCIARIFQEFFSLDTVRTGLQSIFFSF